MNFDGYSEQIKEWIAEVDSTYRKDAEATLKYCNKLIEAGMATDDAKLLGYAYYHLSGTYYCLNDGDKFFETTAKALDYLEIAQEWAHIARCYNVLGIIAVNKGNLPIAYDYFLNGLSYCNKCGLQMDEAIINTNCGCLDIQAGRYDEALEYFNKAYDYWSKQKDNEVYHSSMMCIYENIITCKIMKNQFDGVIDLFYRIRDEHWEHADNIDRIGVLISKAMFANYSGRIEERDSCIKEIDSQISENVAFMDVIDDYFLYATMLLECEKYKEFWHILDTLDPMIRSFEITNMQLKAISLKIQFYKKKKKNAEYLQAAGLYYELSQKREKESNAMMNNVLSLRNRLEKANKKRRIVEQENIILTEKSMTDPLTGMANRGKLNLYADEAFARAMARQHTFAIEILDVDYFKEFNDYYGHQQGDKCLLSVANAIKHVANEHDGFCARYGGDEFVVVYEDVTKEKAGEYAKELKETVTALAIEHKKSKALPIVTVSQGIFCDVPTDDNKVYDFLHIADKMLYKMKELCRNDYCVADKNDYLHH